MQGADAPRPIGLAPLTFLELTPLELVRTAHIDGFDFVGIRLIPGTDQSSAYAQARTRIMLDKTRQWLSAPATH